MCDCSHDRLIPDWTAIQLEYKSQRTDMLLMGQLMICIEQMTNVTRAAGIELNQQVGTANENISSA